MRVNVTKNRFESLVIVSTKPTPLMARPRPRFFLNLWQTNILLWHNGTKVDNQNHFKRESTVEENKPINNVETLLCTRHKSVNVFSLPTGKQLHVVAEMQDSIHHLRIDMVVNHPSLRIKAISCDMQSIPDTLCSQAHNCFNELIGRKVAPGLISEFRKKITDTDGCTHLTNLFHDACYNLFMAQGVMGKKELKNMFPELTEAQIFKLYLLFRPELCNSCVRYADKSPFMNYVKNTLLPDEVQKITLHLRK